MALYGLFKLIQPIVYHHHALLQPSYVLTGGVDLIDEPLYEKRVPSQTQSN